MYRKIVLMRVVYPMSSSALLAATVVASSEKKDEQEKKDLVRARDLPIYNKSSSQSSVKESEKQEESALLAVVRQGREAVWAVSDQFGQISKNFNNVIETGKAHTSSTIQILRDEDNNMLRYGAITGGGLLGYLVAIRRGWFRRLIYTGTGATAVAALCYPEDAKEYSEEGFKYTKRYIVVAYHFVNGGEKKKQGNKKISNLKEPKKDVDPNPEPKPTLFLHPDPASPAVSSTLDDDYSNLYSKRG